MPSWMTHFRIADLLKDKFININTEYFLIGNIAPDCGVPVGDGYNPPTQVTHLTKKDYINKSDCDYEYVYNQYVKNETDINKKSFYIGYMVHLMTDCKNAPYIIFPIQDKFGPISGNRQFSRQIKGEWHNIDFAFCAEHKSPSFELFKTFDGFDEPYPDIYKNNEISWQMKNIVSFYETIKPLDITYKYTFPQDMELFVIRTAVEIYDEIKKRFPAALTA